jgi:hypothetical protein
MLNYKTSINNDGAHVYHNISIANNTNKYQIATFKETRNVPILDKASNYEMSVVRFTVPGSDIPIFVFQYDNQSPPQPVYKVNFRYEFAPGQFKNFAEYVPIINRNIPNVLNQQAIANYIYSYQFFLDMINAAINTAFVAMKAAYPAITQTKTPFLAFTSENIIALHYQQSFSTTPAIKFYLSQSLVNFMPSFNYTGYIILDNPNGNPLGQNDPPAAVQPNNNQFLAFWLPFVDLGNNFISQIYPPNSNHLNDYPGFINRQEFPTLYAWNDVRGLTFITYNIPVLSDAISNTDSRNKDLTFKVLTDFELNTQNGPEARSNISYNPTAEYRIKDLISDAALRTTDISIFWNDKQGNLYPLYIAPNDAITIKIMYRIKGWKNGKY